MTFYVTPFHRTLFKIAARRRGISFSDMVNVALFEFIYKRPTPLSPKDIPILKMIPREDRRPKGNLPIKPLCTGKAKELKNAIKKTPMGEVLKEMHQFFKNPTLKSVPEKWRELRDAELEKELEEIEEEV